MSEFKGDGLSPQILAASEALFPKSLAGPNPNINKMAEAIKADMAVADAELISHLEDMAKMARIRDAAPRLLEALIVTLEFLDSGGLGEGVNAEAKEIIEKYLSRVIANATGGAE